MDGPVSVTLEVWIDMPANRVRMQLLTYGWLYEQTTGEPPVALQVHSGSGEILDIPYEGVEEALELLERMLELRPVEERPVEHVGATRRMRRCLWPGSAGDWKGSALDA